MFEINNTSYLPTVDYYTRFPELSIVNETSSHAIIDSLKENFARHGVPRYVISDNGPQFRSEEYQRFAGPYGFKPVYSSPLYPRSNGQIERFVQTVKQMIKKCAQDHKDIQLELLNYRNRPLNTINASPAQLLMSRRLWSRLPIPLERLAPHTQPDKTKEIRQIQQKKKKIPRHKSRQNTQNHKDWSTNKIPGP